MTVSQPQAVNHHADRPGFAGLRGLLAGATMLVAARSRAQLIVDLASVSDHRCCRLCHTGGCGQSIGAFHAPGEATTTTPATPTLRRLDHEIASACRSSRKVRLNPAGCVVRVTSTAPPRATT